MFKKCPNCGYILTERTYKEYLEMANKIHEFLWNLAFKNVEQNCRSLLAEAYVIREYFRNKTKDR